MSESNNEQVQPPPSRKPYVSKAQREEFMRWLIMKYDLLQHDDRSRLPNPRILSEMYDREKGVKISKVSIYRWIKSLTTYLDAEMMREFDERVSEDISKD